MTVLKTKVNKSVVSGSNRLLKELPREKLTWMLQRMCEIRYFEEKAEDLYVRGLVHGTMHLSIGQEAGSVGSISTLREKDLIIHHHRGHGHTIAKGANLTTMMAEFLGATSAPQASSAAGSPQQWASRWRCRCTVRTKFFCPTLEMALRTKASSMSR
jgi:TPP-dependent pyruvate/acetoin dehydrogenase alpha subunit